MKLVLGDAEYDVMESLNFATLGALVDLQEQSATAKFEGITDPYIRDAFVKASELPAGTPLRGQLDFTRALMGIVFLAKRRAGEDVSYAQVREIPYHEAKLRLDAKELVADDDPKESGAAASAQPVQ